MQAAQVVAVVLVGREGRAEHDDVVAAPHWKAGYVFAAASVRRTASGTPPAALTTGPTSSSNNATTSSGPTRADRWWTAIDTSDAVLCSAAVLDRPDVVNDADSDALYGALGDDLVGHSSSDGRRT
jgi:hypothetical protein